MILCDADNDDRINGLMADEVNMVRFGVTGLDRLPNTANDYTVRLRYIASCPDADLEIFRAPRMLSASVALASLRCRIPRTRRATSGSCLSVFVSIKPKRGNPHLWPSAGFALSRSAVQIRSSAPRKSTETRYLAHSLASSRFSICLPDTLPARETVPWRTSKSAPPQAARSATESRFGSKGARHRWRHFDG